MKLISPRLNPPLNPALDLGFEDGDFLRHGKRSVDGFSFGIRAKKCLDSIDAALIDEHIFSGGVRMPYDTSLVGVCIDSMFCCITEATLETPLPPRTFRSHRCGSLAG